MTLLLQGSDLALPVPSSAGMSPNMGLRDCSGTSNVGQQGGLGGTSMSCGLVLMSWSCSSETWEGFGGLDTPLQG